ncbi:hypothetical protein CHS0354_009609 [Potamilus streckersoni]|uniref:Uncharacterized protein n=1 Tax=Potamilus streckersoni TaxID=2493646 RepID=A0AAE0WED8_9BIVA|nr:hypothetical protein CHS0354_009609 [Potamilus streckersoni]
MALIQKHDMRWLHVVSVLLLVILYSIDVYAITQDASYHCEVNPSDSSQIIFKFRLLKNDDTVAAIKMYNASKTSSFDRATDEQIPSECTKLDDSVNKTTDPINHNIFFNPSNAMPCGMSKEGNVVKAVYRTEAIIDTDSAIDKFYLCQCDITTALQHIVDNTVQVSDIQYKKISNARSAALEIYDSSDALVTSSATKNLGDIIYFRVTYSRNVTTEKVFPIRAYVDELDIASVSTFTDSVKLIDNGCPTSDGTSLAGNGFGTFSNNPVRSTGNNWVLETPKFQTFSKEDHVVGIRENYFRARLGYCFLTSDPNCLSPSCPARKKRDVDETVVCNDYMQTILVVKERDFEDNPGPSVEPDCSKSVPFILIVTLMLIILVTEVTVTGAMSFKIIRKYKVAY